MLHPTDKVHHLLPSLHAISERIFAVGVGPKTRRVLYASALMCALAASITLTQRILVKVHLRSIGGKMRAKLDALLRHLPHLSAQEFEAYVNKSVDGLSLHYIENHLKVCHVCKEDVDIVQQAIRDFESDRVFITSSHEKCPTTQRFHWADKSTLWIDDETYQLKPVGDVPTRVLVEGLTFNDLEKMVEEDIRVPGTHLVSIESKGSEVIAPLSKFAIIRVTPSANDAKQPSYPLENDVSGVIPPTLSHQGERLIVEIFVDSRGSVLLGTRTAKALSHVA